MPATERQVTEIIISADDVTRAERVIVGAFDHMGARAAAAEAKMQASAQESLRIYGRNLPQAVDRVGEAYARLQGKLDPVIAAQQRAEREMTQSLATINRAVLLGVTTEQQATRDIARLKAQQVDYINSVRDAHLAANASVQRMQSPANDNAAGFRRGNLINQGLDVGVSLQGGMPLATVAIQQGSQIAGAYAGAGGVKALLSDILDLAGSVLRVAGPVAAALGVVYGAYKLLEANSVSARLAVDDTTAALAAQAVPFTSIAGMVSDLADVQVRYREAITATSATQSAATALAVANTEREFNARKALLEIELKRQDAALAAQRAELAIAGQGLKEDLSAQVFTDMSRANNGFSDPRVGRLVNLPDEITGLAKTQAMIDANPAIDAMTEMRSNLTLGELAVQKLRDALGATFDGRLIEPAKEKVSATTAAMDGLRAATDAWGESLGRIKSIGLPQLTDRQALDKAYGALGNTPFGDANDAALRAYNEAEKRIANAEAGALAPIPTMRPNREDMLAEADKPILKEASAYQRVVESANERMAQMRGEIGLYGQIGPAAEAARIELQLINQATEKGKSLAPDQLSNLKALAAQLGAVADEAVRVKFNSDIRFQAQQADRNEVDRGIYGRLRGTPYEGDPTMIHYLRDGDQTERMRQSGADFADRIADGMLNQGESLGEAFANAIREGAMDTLQETLKDLFRQLMQAAFPMPQAPNVGLPRIGAIPLASTPGNMGAMSGVGRSATDAVGLGSSLLGFSEVGNRGQINSFLKAGGVDLDAAQQAWCAAFVNSSLKQIGVEGSGSNVASSFMGWGSEVTGAAMRGDVLIQGRGRALGQVGSHVGLATGASRMGSGGLEYEMLSGNLVNKVGQNWVQASEVMVRRATQTADALGTVTQSAATAGNGLGGFGQMLSQFPAAPGAPAGGGGGGLFGWLGNLFGGGARLSPAAWNVVSSGGMTGLFDRGGFTGAGPVDQVAGLAHKGEFYFSAEATKNLGLDYLHTLHEAGKRGSGFRAGGYAGSSVPRMQATANNPGVSVSIVNPPGMPAMEEASRSETQDPDGNRRVEIRMRTIARDEMTNPAREGAKTMREQSGVKRRVGAN